MPLPSEYESFQLLIESLDKAAGAALTLGGLRYDQKHIWEKMAEGLAYSRDIAYQVVGEGQVGKHRN